MKVLRLYFKKKQNKTKTSLCIFIIYLGFFFLKRMQERELVACWSPFFLLPLYYINYF